MKIKKIIDACKTTGRITIRNGFGDVQWLGDGQAYYALYGCPNFTAESLTAAYDLSADKVIVEESENTPPNKLLADDTENDIPIERYISSINISGSEVIFTDTGAVFIPSKYLSPFEKDDTQNYYLRRTGKINIIAVFRGISIIAVIAPSHIVTEKFIDELSELCDRCRLTYDNEAGAL